MNFIDRTAVLTPNFFQSPDIMKEKKKIAAFYDKGDRKTSRLKIEYNEKELHKILMECFHGKCAFCESPVAKGGEIEHFRPWSGAKGFQDFSKDHYGWLAYEWENIYLVCQDCHRYKSEWFPVNGPRIKVLTSIKETIKTEKNILIDPCNDNPVEHFSYSTQGMIRSFTEEAKITIDLLKLNRPGLVKARKSVAQNILRMFDTKRKLRVGKEEIETVFQEVYGNNEFPWRGIAKHFLSLYTYPLIEQVPSKYRSMVSNAHYIRMSRIPRYKITSKAHTKELNKHIYLDRLEVSNYSCFSKLDIKFAESDRNLKTADGRFKEPWMLFMGENGAGKSSLLRAIALCLMTDAYRKKIGVRAKDILRNGTDAGFIKLYLKEEKNPITLTFDKYGKIRRAKIKPVNLVGYGAIRVLPRGPLRIEKGKPFPVKTQNLFDYTVALNNAENWLNELSLLRFKEAALALKDLLQLPEQSRIIRMHAKKQILIDNAGTKAPLEQLSDGYKTVLALTVDIMSTFIHAQQSFDTAEGVVLVDEIGTHLHPTWKMAIVESLRNTFPKLQFFVTTHEPLCLRGLGRGEVVLLKRGTDGVQVFTDLPDPSALRIDELLTSDYFGLHSTVDPVVERKFIEYYNLLAKPETEWTVKEKERAGDLKKELPHDRDLGLDLRDELVYSVVDSVLARRETFEPVANLKKQSIELFNQLWKKSKPRKRAVK